MMTTNTNTSASLFRPSFGIYRADGSKHPTLKRNFIIKMDLYTNDLRNGYVTLVDGTNWALSAEQEVKDAIQAVGDTFCIVSFQVHEHGNYAVARKYSAKKLAASHYATDRRKNND